MSISLPADRLPAVIQVLQEHAYGLANLNSENTVRNPSPLWTLRIEEDQVLVTAMTKIMWEEPTDAFMGADRLCDSLMDAAGTEAIQGTNHIGTVSVAKNGKTAGWRGTVDLRLWQGGLMLKKPCPITPYSP